MSVATLVNEPMIPTLGQIYLLINPMFGFSVLISIGDVVGRLEFVGFGKSSNLGFLASFSCIGLPKTGSSTDTSLACDGASLLASDFLDDLSSDFFFSLSFLKKLHFFGLLFVLQNSLALIIPK